MSWLPGWAKRVKLTIDQTDIDATLSNFPILLYLSTSSGRNAADLSFVFDEIGANKLKIAVTTSDGITQCYVEIEQWDSVTKEAWLWVKVPSIAADVDTDLYLYYDNTQADNTAYVGGDPNDAASQAVWDADYVLVHHLQGATATALDDSTTNNNDITAFGGNPAFNIPAKIGNGVDFERDTVDHLEIPDADSLDVGSGGTPATWEFWFNAESIPTTLGTFRSILCKYDTTGSQRQWFINIYVRTAPIPHLQLMWSGDGVTYASGAVDISDLSTGTWYYVAIIWKPNALPIIYINAVPRTVIHYDSPVTATIFAGTSVLDIGKCTYTPEGRYYDGKLDEIRISNTERVAAWIKASFETQRDHLLYWGREEPILETISFHENISMDLYLKIVSPFAFSSLLFSPWLKIVHPTISFSCLHFSPWLTISPIFLSCFHFSPWIRIVEVSSTSLWLRDEVTPKSWLPYFLTETLSLASSILFSLKEIIYESLVFTEARILWVFKAFNELFESSEILPKHLGKFLPVLLVKVDTVEKNLALEPFLESMLLSPLFLKTFLKHLFKSISFQDTYSFLSSLTCFLPEHFQASDILGKKTSHLFLELLSLSVVFTVLTSFRRLFSEVLTIADLLRHKIASTFLEQLQISDAVSFLKSFIRLFSEVLVSTGLLWHRSTKTFLERLQVTDLFATLKSFVRVFKEVLTITDFCWRKFARTLQDMFQLSDLVSKFHQSIQQEILQLQDLISKIASSLRIQTLNLLDALSRSISLMMEAERLSFIDVRSSIISYSRQYSEILQLQSDLFFTVTKFLIQVFGIKEKRHMRPIKLCLEEIKTMEEMTRLVMRFWPAYLVIGDTSVRILLNRLKARLIPK